MKKTGLAVLTALLILSGCGAKKLPEGAVAQVNGTVITQADFDAELDAFKGQYESQGQTVSDDDLAIVKPQILDSLVLKQLMTDKADELKITADSEAIQAQIDGIKAQFGSDEAFAASLAESNFTEEALVEELKLQSVIQQLFESEVASKVNVEEKDIQAYYDENKEAMFQKPESVSASHILIQVNEEKTAEAALAEIQDIRKEIEAGLDFGDAAVKYSEGPSSAQRGSLGVFGRGQMVPEFEEVAFAQEEGAVSEPVLTQFGYHLILTSGRFPAATASFEEARGFIEQQLKQTATQDASRAFVDGLKDKAKIVLPEWAQEKEQEQTS